MDTEIEKIIIKSFFLKRYHERILFELSSYKRRRDALFRLSHNYNSILNPKYMIEIPKPNSDYNDIEKMLRNLGGEDLCYVISLEDSIDGQVMPLRNALQNAVGYGLPSIVSSIPGKLAYFEAEQTAGAPPRFILKKD